MANHGGPGVFGSLGCPGNLHSFLSRFKKKDQGQTLLEFAFVLPVMLLLLLGIIQFGFVFNGWITVTSAAREGARLAVVCSDDQRVKDRVEEAAVALLLDVERGEGIKINRAADGDSDKLSVEVKGTIDIIMPLLDLFTGDSIEVSSKSVMRVEAGL